MLKLYTAALDKCGLLKQPFTRQENTVIQTCVVASSGIAFSSGTASYLLGMSKDVAAQLETGNDPNNIKKLAPGWMIAYLFAVSFVGLFSVVPLRRVMILRSKLTYPSGTATAYLINNFHTPKGAKLANWFAFGHNRHLKSIAAAYWKPQSNSVLSSLPSFTVRSSVSGYNTPNQYSQIGPLSRVGVDSQPASRDGRVSSSSPLATSGIMHGSPLSDDSSQHSDPGMLNDCITNGVVNHTKQRQLDNALYSQCVSAMCTLAKDPSPRISGLGRRVLSIIGIEQVVTKSAKPNTGGARVGESSGGARVGESYANAKIYKCEDDRCPRPMCYRAYGSGKEDSPQCEVPGFENSKMKLMRHVSFADCPASI